VGLSWLVYLRRPPPARAREAPTLADPRLLLLLAALLVGRLLEAPPNALPLRLEPAELLGMLRLPTRSLALPARFVPALVAPRFAPTLPLRPALVVPARFVAALPLRLALAAGCVRAEPA
jgi:hypothetical protein